MKPLMLIGLILVALFDLAYESQVSASKGYDWQAKNWGLSKIHANEAWEAIHNDRRPVVAVIDTGIDKTHYAIRNNISNFGYDFVGFRSPSSINDSEGHGTHVTGIILATANFHALVVPLKFYEKSNSEAENVKNTVNAINFAVDHGAKIINYSGGGKKFDEDEYLALKRAEKYGVLVVAAAGNEKEDIDVFKNYYYPASYGLSNIISVASSDAQGYLVESSNWGKIKVDVAAPGEKIFSTFASGRFAWMTGTSQATAFVTGIAALLLSENPTLKAKDLKRIILRTAEPKSTLPVRVGLVNALAAVNELKIYNKQ